MAGEALVSLRNIGAALQHIGGAMRECHTHATAGSKTPLAPLDAFMAGTVRDLQREGQTALATAMLDLHQTMKGAINEA